MVCTKTTANPPPLNINYRDLYPRAPVELLDECSSLVSTKAWRDHIGDPITYDHRAFCDALANYISMNVLLCSFLAFIFVEFLLDA